MATQCESFSPLRKNVSLRHETPIEGKVGQSQEHCSLLGHYVKGVPAFQLLRTWLWIKLLLPAAISDTKKLQTSPALSHTIPVTRNKRPHSYDAQLLEIVVNSVDSFRDIRGQRPSTKMIRQKSRYDTIRSLASAERERDPAAQYTSWIQQTVKYNNTTQSSRCWIDRSIALC